MVDAAIADAIASATASLNTAVSQLDQRITANTAALVGLPQTQQAVDDLVQNVNFLLDHAQNVTICANNGSVHTGGGSCVSPVPRCEQPTAPAGGSVTLSSNYIIPGVTATYSCSGQNTFVAGPTVRTCMESTQNFSEFTPRCLTCGVVNCVQCVNTTSTCVRCATAHDLTADGSQCVARADTVVMLGGQYAGSGHNFNQVQQLPPNANTFGL
jgi:hypothetical protein